MPQITGSLLGAGFLTKMKIIQYILLYITLSLYIPFKVCGKIDLKSKQLGRTFILEHQRLQSLEIFPGPPRRSGVCHGEQVPRAGHIFVNVK